MAKGGTRDREVDKLIGANLRRIRVLRGLSQEKLGDELGLTFQQVQKYEKGSNSIAAARIPKLCAILGVTIEQLFDGTMKGLKPAKLESLSPAAIRFARDLDKLPKFRTAISNVIEAIIEEV